MLACVLATAGVAIAHADGAVYYWGDFVTNGVERVGRYDVRAGTSAVLPLDSLQDGSGIEGVGAAPHGSTIAVAGAMDGSLNGVLYRFGPLGGVATPLRTGATTDNYSDITFSPDSAWIAFLSDLDLDGSFALYVVPSGGGAVTRVSQAPVSSTQDITDFAWAGDSHTIAFRGDPVTNNVNSLWTADVTDPVATRTEVVPGGAPDPHVQPAFGFGADGRVYFISDYQQAGLHRLYRANADGSGLEPLPGTSLANGGGEASVGTLALSPDGRKIAFSADAPEAGLSQVYTMPLAGTTPVRVSGVQAVSDGFVRGPGQIAWSPDETHLAVTADWNPGDGAAPGDYSACVLPAFGPAGGVRVLAASTAIDAQQLAFASSTSLIVLGDFVVNNDSELFEVTDFTSADQNPVDIRIQAVPTGGDVLGFTVVPIRADPPEPEIVSITDVGNDQGRQVSLVWKASGLDAAGSQLPVTEYAIFRRIDTALAQAASAGSANRARRDTRATAPAAVQLGGWHYLTSVPAFAESEYAVVVPTLEDSTVNEGLYSSVFMVRAATAQPALFVDSAADSGYSVDNLAPAVPANLVFQAPRVLAWDPPAEADFAYHTVYGSPTGSMDDAVLIGHTVDPTFDVNAAPYAYYLVTTTDFSGNEGADAALMDPATTGAEAAPPGAFAFVAATPNPFHTTVAFTFDVPRAGSVEVRLFDSSGRAVRGLVARRFTPGRYTAHWDGADDRGHRVAPGVYFARIRAGTFEASRRIVRTR